MSNTPKTRLSLISSSWTAKAQLLRCLVKPAGCGTASHPHLQSSLCSVFITRQVTQTLESKSNFYHMDFFLPISTNNSAIFTIECLQHPSYELIYKVRINLRGKRTLNTGSIKPTSWVSILGWEQKCDDWNGYCWNQLERHAQPKIVKCSATN